ncbi:MAG: hypothetical protein ACM337_08325, partial [Syntrophaceae bacterium]
MTRNPGETIFLAAVLAVLAGLCFFVLPPGLSSSEEAVQAVQMKNFALHGSGEIRPPAFALGFEAADFAGHRGFFDVRNGGLYATPPPLYPWVASLLVPAFGERTARFTPILFVFLAALVLGLLMDRVMKRGVLYWLLLSLFLIGSPVFLQGLLFSGMALALFLVTSALWLLAGHFSGNPAAARLFGASVLMGLSGIARAECLLMACSFWISTALVLVLQRRLSEVRTVLAGCAVSLTAFVFHDVVFHGRFPGPYLQFYLPFYALSPIRLAVLGGVLSLSLGLLIVSMRDEAIRPARRAALSTLAVILPFGAVLVTAARISVSHLMAFFPAVLFVFYGVPRRLERWKNGEGVLELILTAAVVVSLVIGASILRPGPQVVLSVWLPMIPFVVVLLALERRTLFAAPGMAVVLAFFCGVAFVNGIQEAKEHILNYRAYTAAYIAFLEKHTSKGDVVLVEDAGHMLYAGPLFFDRVFLVARNPDEQGRLLCRLRNRPVTRIYA